MMQFAAAADEVSAAARDFSAARAERDAAQGEQRRLRADLQKVHTPAWRLTSADAQAGRSHAQPARLRKKTVCSLAWQALWLRRVACWCRCSAASILCPAARAA
jgi:hypothetical protein